MINDRIQWGKKFLQIFFSQEFFFGSQRVKGLEFLGKKLKRLVSLKSLNLALVDCPADLHEGFVNLGKAIGGLISLESLNIEIPPDVRCLEIGESFKSLKKLKTLSLRFSQVENQGFYEFSEGLKELELLENVNIDFSDCSEMTDQSLGSVIQALSKCRNMKEFSVNFSYCEKITDIGLESISETIKNFTSLTLKNDKFIKIKQKLFGPR